MLPLTDAKHHEVGPKDLGMDPERKPVMTVDIARTTNQTGEQLHIGVPLYATDSREDVNNRLGFAYALIQDRLESENKAVEFSNSRAEIVRRTQLIVQKNEQHCAKQMEQLKKDLNRKKISKETFESKREQLMKDLKKANDENIAEAEHAQRELEAGKVLPKEGKNGEAKSD